MQQIDASPAATGATGTTKSDKPDVNGGRFDFDDGGTYCGGWEDGKAHGHGVCTGPKGQGAYSGSWHFGFEVSGVYTWPSGSAYEGQWQNGKRHGLGVESRGRWVYRGEWTQGAKGRYGVRQSAQSTAKYEGTWASGLQDGYGSETYADGGTFQGQWLRGMRHGYGVRASAPFGQASRPPKGTQGQQQQLRASQSSLDAAGGGAGGGSSGGSGGGALDPAAERDRRVDDTRGGFVLKAKSDEPPARRRSLVEKSGLKKSILSGLKLRKQRSTGDIEKRANSGGSMRSNASSASWVSTESEQSGFTSASVHTDSNASFIIEDEHMDASVVETYLGEWKNDKRSGFGISERSDGLRYEGEWFANKKYGYGVTTFKDGTKEEGKYKNNVLITSQKKKHLFLIRSAKFRERIDAAVNAAQRASKIALQKADIAVSRTATARAKAELADIAADAAREDCEIARATAKQYAPDFQQPGLDRVRRDLPRYRTVDEFAPPKSILTKTGSLDPGAMGSSVGPSPSSLLQQQQQSSQQQPQSHQQQLLQQQLQQHHQHQQQYQMPPSQQSLMMQQQLSNAMPQQQMPNAMPQYRQDTHNNPNFAYQDNAYPQSSGAGYGYQNAGLSPQQQGYGFQQTVTPPTPNMADGYPPKPAYYPNKSGSIDAGSARVPNSMSIDDGTASVGNRGGLRRNSRLVTTQDNPGYNFQQAMSDHFDQYKRPPSRDSSVDRYSRVTAAAAGRLSVGSRQPSVDKTGIEQDRSMRAGSSARGTTPAPSGLAGNGSAVGAGMPSSANLIGASNPIAPAPYTVPMREQPFEDVILRKRGLGQDIIPSPGQPKRTESLYINPQSRAPQKQSIPLATAIQRKKSLPDVAGMPGAIGGGAGGEAMSREEVSVLSSARREEVRRMQEESERLRANPLLYLVSPHVKEWFSRQQLVMLVLFVNISLAIMFFKLLT